MTTFKEILAELPSVEGIHSIELYLQDAAEPYAEIPNAEGKRGSLMVYNQLIEEFGSVLNKECAERGLELFAEHTEDARQNPGAHPNIDRLFEIIEENRQDLMVTVVHEDE